MLTIETYICPSVFPFESFIGFQRFTIEFHERRAELKVAEFIKVIADFVQKLKFSKNEVKLVFGVAIAILFVL